MKSVGDCLMNAENWHVHCPDCGGEVETCFPAWIRNDGTVADVDGEADPLAYYCPQCGGDRAVDANGREHYGRC